MNDPKCRSCGLHHRAMIVCSVARRLHASGNLIQPGDTVAISEPVKLFSQVIQRQTLAIVAGVNDDGEVLIETTTRTTDRHSKDDMKTYMQKRRAEKKAAAK